MAKSKVKDISFNHEWYNKKYSKEMFEFSIVFEDGVNATFNSTKRDQKTAVIGQEIEYNITGENPSGITKISIVTPRTESKGGFNDPTNNRRMAQSMAQSCALDALINLSFHSISQDHVLKIADYFHTWIVLNTNDERNLMSLKWYAIERAVSFIKTYHTEKISDDAGLNLAVAKIKTVAEIFYNHIIKE